MKFLLKPIYEFITGQYVLFEKIVYNYIAMIIIGVIAFNIAWKTVGKLYNDNYIHGGVLGSIIHWAVRLIAFLFIFYIFVGVIWIINNIRTVLIIIGLIFVGIIGYKIYDKKRIYKQYLEKELSSILNKLSSNIQSENKNLVIYLHEKGIESSGAVFEFENNLIKDNINKAIINIEKLFNESNIDFNSILNKKESVFFIDKIQQNINIIMNRYYEQIEKQHEAIVDAGIKQQLYLWQASLKQNVMCETNNIFDKIHLRKSGKKIEKMVLIGLILSIISVIEGAVSIYIALK